MKSPETKRAETTKVEEGWMLEQLQALVAERHHTLHVVPGLDERIVEARRAWEQVRD